MQAASIVALQSIILAIVLLQRDGEPSSFDQQRLARNFGTNNFHRQWGS